MQKKGLYILLCAFVFSLQKGYAQQVGINEDGSLPNLNAILDVKSPNKGVLIPRMSSSSRITIPATKGLLVYDTTTNTFWYHTGTSWQNMLFTSASGDGWLLNGNSAVSESHFLGPINKTLFRIKVGGAPSGLIDPDNGNAFWGYNSGAYVSTDSYDNTGVGAYSLHANTTGVHNTATGKSALSANSEGSDNTANGSNALLINGTGNSNTAMGSHALALNTTGNFNTAIGRYAMVSSGTGSNNTASGSHALAGNTSGSYNTASGGSALYSNGRGNYNTATGYFALTNNFSGMENTATGANAMTSNIGSYNTATGAYTMTDNQGSFNTATGYYALKTNGRGGDNTASGFASMFTNTSGSRNVAYGFGALITNTTGNNNTAVGYLADVNLGNLTNATAIGYGAVVSMSNKVRIGNSGVIRIEGAVPFTTPSDGRFKYGVLEDVKGLDFILQLRPVTYNFDVQKFDAQQRGPQGDSLNTVIRNTMKDAYAEAAAIRRSGFIAQEVESAAAKSGYNFSGIVKPKDTQDHYSLSYESFVVPLVKAIQEQQKIITDLQQQVAELKRQVKPSK